MPIDMTSPAKDWILAARDNAPEDLANGVKWLFNCREVEISAEGGVYIADPQAGHWLGADDLDVVGRALKAGDI